MTTATIDHATIAAVWRARPTDLSRWAWGHLVNRDDVWVAYLPFHRRRRHGNSITVPSKEQRGIVTLTGDVLRRHFHGLHEYDIIGLHSTSPTNTSRWLRIDIDCHGGDDATLPERNRAAAIFWHDKLVSLGFTPLLIDSNGRGGFQLDTIFGRPVATPIVYSFGQWLVSDYRKIGLTECPESFPKQPRIGPDEYGNAARLPGRHHTYDHWSRVWGGDHWLDGADAIDSILSTAGDDPNLIPFAAMPDEPPAAVRIHPQRTADSGDRLSDEEIACRCLSHIPNADAHYDVWLAIGAACHSVNSGRGMYEAWCSWSRSSGKHDDRRNVRTWQSFRRSSSGGGGNVATLGTLVHLAGRHGFDVFAERRKELREKYERDRREAHRPTRRHRRGVILTTEAA